MSINLNEYDDTTTIDKTWIDPNYKRLYSYEITYKPFYTILSKYNPIDKETYFYIVVTDDVIPNKMCKAVMRTKSNACKIDLLTIWDRLRIIGNEKFAVSITKEDEDEHMIIYKLNL